MGALFFSSEHPSPILRNGTIGRPSLGIFAIALSIAGLFSEANTPSENDLSVAEKQTFLQVGTANVLGKPTATQGWPKHPLPFKS